MNQKAKIYLLTLLAFGCNADVQPEEKTLNRRSEFVSELRRDNASLSQDATAESTGASLTVTITQTNTGTDLGPDTAIQAAELAAMTNTLTQIDYVVVEEEAPAGEASTSVVTELRAELTESTVTTAHTNIVTSVSTNNSTSTVTSLQVDTILHTSFATATLTKTNTQVQTAVVTDRTVVTHVVGSTGTVALSCTLTTEPATPVAGQVYKLRFTGHGATRGLLDNSIELHLPADVFEGRAPATGSVQHGAKVFDTTGASASCSL